MCVKLHTYICPHSPDTPTCTPTPSYNDPPICPFARVESTPAGSQTVNGAHARWCQKPLSYYLAFLAWSPNPLVRGPSIHLDGYDHWGMEEHSRTQSFLHSLPMLHLSFALLLAHMPSAGRDG
eukprot:1161821-Pelagomonas_calceolata.AAC.12